MPVLFLISGMLAWPSYERKGPQRFMVSKVKRLVVPLLLCTFLFSPIMPFIRMLERSGEAGIDAMGFWPFWLDFVSSGSDVYAGSPVIDTDLVVNQYWFLGLLFVFFTAFWLYELAGGRAMTPAHLGGSESQRSPKALLVLLAAFGLVLALVYAVSGIFIDANVWVGDSAIICKGVHLGENCIIGVGSVVVDDVPANTIAAGNPAKVVKTLDPDETLTTRSQWFADPDDLFRQISQIDRQMLEGNTIRHWLRHLLFPSQGD